MAFNFNWSPLSTSPDFLPKARDLLTSALNRADPKPAIIVSPITVNELHLGTLPPELEILEIGDLAEDRFRGTFKMTYKGDAYLTIKTKVQANPLNTYLGTRSSRTGHGGSGVGGFGPSPRVLAADTGLTIPLQITLSEFRLSGFIILVFSRQKGLTIVFRNDPLESLRVSSTFDSIPFVANFLQKEIETQLRGLLMDELPAIIHRLSLQLLQVPEHKTRAHTPHSKDEAVVDPLASPPQDPVDSTGSPLSAAEIASLSLDSGIETQSLFSRKNLLRLATLTDSHRTLSLFTPNIRDAVFRAWTGPLERGEMSGLLTRATTPALSRTHSYAGSIGTSTAQTFDSTLTGAARPSLHSFASSASGLSMGASRHGQGHRTRKRKKRVVDLRPRSVTGESETTTEDGSTADSASVSETTSSATSVFSAPAGTLSTDPSQTHPLNPVTLPRSPVKLRRSGTYSDRASPHDTDGLPGLALSTSSDEPPSFANDIDQTPRARDPNSTIRRRPQRISTMPLFDDDETPRASMYISEAPRPSSSAGIPAFHAASDEKRPSEPGPSAPQPLPNFLAFATDPSNAGSIAERAWMAKMASEMARRYEEERLKGSFGPVTPRSDDAGEERPPAYAR
jgi:mitochondrial distribution and morphology protein 34